MQILTTIIPIFAVIFTGYLARKRGFIRADFLEPANALVYYLAIPAMVFNAISQASLTTHFDITVLIITLTTVVGCFVLAWIVGIRGRLHRNQLGSYIQASFHGNLGYIGLAVTFYYLGKSGLVKASILTGFIMILQNFLSVLVLTIYARQPGSAGRAVAVVRKIAANPVVLSAMAGMTCSLVSLTVPVIIQRSLDILGGLALPLALLIIGASISFQELRRRIRSALSAAAIKLVLMPALAYVGFVIAGSGSQEFLPALILLASPSATISYVMAKEMKGDPDFAVTAVSLSTSVSAITFALWLQLAV